MVKFMGFNSRTRAMKWYRLHSNGDPEPRFVPEGEDPFSPAHIWEACLVQKEDNRTSKRTRSGIEDPGQHESGGAPSKEAKEGVPPSVKVTAAATKRP